MWQRATIDAPESPQWVVTFQVMSNTNLVRKMSPKARVTALLSATAFAFAALPASAQSDIQWDRPAPPSYNQPASGQYQSAPQAGYISPREAESLAAPIALFPDSLVAQILMAATYPYDVEDAANWVSDPRNGRLVGYQLQDALEGMDWDPSVKALTSAPDVLRMMNERRDWTARLGEAFAADQGMMMDAVQHLRREAREAGRLSSDRYRRILDRDGEIIIEPFSPSEIYLEYYDPRVAFGSWAYSDYPPYYFPPVYYQVVRPISVYAPLWGWSSWDWRGRSLHLDVGRWRDLNHNRSHVIVGNTWRHDEGRNQGRDFRGRTDRTNFGTNPGSNFGGRNRNPSTNTPAQDFRGRGPGANPGNDQNRDNTRERSGRDRRQEANANPATPTPEAQNPGRRQFNTGDFNRGWNQRRQQTPQETNAVPTPTPQPQTAPTPDQGRFGRGNGGRGEGGRGEGGWQRREEAPRQANANPAPQAPAPTFNPRFRGNESAAANPNANAGQDRKSVV